MSYQQMIAKAFATRTPIKVQALTGAQFAELLNQLRKERK